LNPTVDDWRTLLDAIDAEEPPALELAEGLAGAFDLDPVDAQDAVYAAIDDGTLVEEGDGFGAIRLAEDVVDADPDESTDTAEEEGGSPGSNPGEDTDKKPSSIVEKPESWENADFTNPSSGRYPPEHNTAEVWMGAVGKQAFAPWGDRNHPDAPADKDARWKWGVEANYADGETVDTWIEKDPRLTGRAFIQRESDPYAFVDGDDVRDPDTGDVHPAFRAILSHLGFTYADVSTSGSGVHAYYKGELPIEGKGQAAFEIDTDPWGANDEPPTVEIYANTHLAITEGEHVPGTPLDVVEWDGNALRAILEAHGYEDKERLSHDTDKERSDLEEYDPTASTADETTDDIRDVLKAVDRVRPSDLRLRTSKVGTDSTGWEKWDPSSYRTSSGGDSLHRPAGEGVFHDHKHGEAFGVLSLLAAEEGIISNPWDRLEGGDWWDAVDAARDSGAPIPDYVGGKTHESEPVAVLPQSVRDLSHATTGFDWRHTARQGSDTLTLEDARERATDTIADAYQYGDRVLVEALPAIGKSYGSVKAAAETGEPVTVLTLRGHKEQYAQLKEWCEKFGLSYYQLPSFTRDCDTANGEYDDAGDWSDTVEDWYSRGATPKEIHKNAEYELGRPLPCQAHKGETCPYTAKWDFDPDEYDVLIGHYSHAYREEKVVSGRTVVLDEFPGAYETSLGATLQGAVSYWLKSHDGVPFDDYTDLLENRGDESRRADALLWFEEHGVEPDETGVFDSPNAHAAAPLAVFTILAGDDLGNGFERADVEGVGTGVRNRETGGVSILRPPALEYASGVVALDGTPTKELWELALGERLNHRTVLQGDERAEYIQEALNLNLVRTSPYVKPYNSKEHVNTESDGALLEEIADAHGEQPGLITSSTAISEYKEADLLDLLDGSTYYGNVLGSNEFKEKRLGAVIGSNHYGDDYIKKWGAYAGETVERNDEKGADLSYGGFGDKVLTHMREHDTLQAVMRFGRDGNGSVVYVHTDTLPEWVPIAGEGRVVSTWSDGMKAVVRTLETLETATTAEIVETVDLSRQQVFEHLEALRERGVLDREQDETDGRRFVWVDDGLHRIGEHGEAELEPVDLEDLDESEVRQLARSSIYTWEFTNRDADTDRPGRSDGAVSSTTSKQPATGGGGPPDSD